VFETPQSFAVLWAGAARVFFVDGSRMIRRNWRDAAFFVGTERGEGDLYESVRADAGMSWVKSLRRRTPEVAATAIADDPVYCIVTVH